MRALPFSTLVTRMGYALDMFHGFRALMCFSHLCLFLCSSYKLSVLSFGNFWSKFQTIHWVIHFNYFIHNQSNFYIFSVILKYYFPVFYFGFKATWILKDVHFGSSFFGECNYFHNSEIVLALRTPTPYRKKRGVGMLTSISVSIQVLSVWQAVLNFVGELHFFSYLLSSQTKEKTVWFLSPCR
jgi:hypothetical protein